MKLPRLTGKQMRDALLRAGFQVVRIKGSHHFMVDPNDTGRWATVSVHSGEILTLKSVQSILKSTRVTVEELKELL